VEVVELGRASLLVDQRCRRDDTLLAEGSIRIGCVDAGTIRPRRIPNSILERLA
jgi:acyl-CoA thioester hydrolase